MNERHHELSRYNLWACELLCESMRTVPRPARTLEILAHTGAAGMIWLARIQGRGDTPPVWPELSVPQAMEQLLVSARALVEYSAALTPEELQRVVEYRNSQGTVFTNTVAEVLDHVGLHYHYHRGQLATLIRQEGGEPAATDYLFYLRRQ